MTRLIGPDEKYRVIYNEVTGLIAMQGTSVPLYADATLTTPADVLSAAGTAIPTSSGIPTLTIDASSRVPEFLFPDVADPEVWTSINGGPATRWLPADDPRLDALVTRVTAAEAAITAPISGLTSAAFAAGSIDGAVGTPSLRTIGSGAQQAASGATVQSLLAEDPTTTVRLQSGYSRNSINAGTGSGATVGAVALCTDPAVAGRIWYQGLDFGQLCRTDDNFTTGTAVGAPPAGTSAGIFHLQIANGFMWILQGPSAAASGSLWRSPAPNASGGGISWTKVFDLAAPPGGITVGDQATFRNASVAISGANVYLLEYSVATITGGPSLYYSSDSGATWVKRWTWANAKHGHAVQVISGVPWVSFGDSGSSFSDIGLWCATTAAATSFSRKSVYGEASGGNTWYVINFMQVAMGSPAVNMILGEYDGLLNYGPICYPSVSISSAKALLPMSRLPPSVMGTMRQMTLDSNGNLWWVHTGENTAVGPYDSVCVARGPWFNSVVVVESIASAGAPFQSIGNPVVNGQYIYLGKYRITTPKFVGQP